MTDHELLALAAKAAGLAELSAYDKDMQRFLKRWNPLDDDYDAFRLAVQLQLITRCYAERIIVSAGFNEATEELAPSDCRYTATRRAIVRCAAQSATRKQ